MPLCLAITIAVFCISSGNKRSVDYAQFRRRRVSALSAFFLLKQKKFPADLVSICRDSALPAPSVMARRRRRRRNIVNPRSGTPCRRRRRRTSIERSRRRRRRRICIDWSRCHIDRRGRWRSNSVDHGRNSAPDYSDDSRGKCNSVVVVMMRRRRRRSRECAPAHGDGTDCCQKKFHCFHNSTSLCVWFRSFLLFVQNCFCPI